MVSLWPLPSSRLAAPHFLCMCMDLTRVRVRAVSCAGVGEEAVQPDEGDQGAEAGAQHLRRREWGSPHSRRQGSCLFLRVRSLQKTVPFFLILLAVR